MKRIMAAAFFFLAVSILFSQNAFSSDEGHFRTVVDSRGIKVKIPQKIDKIITISDGLVEGTLMVLDEIDKLIAVGSKCLQTNYEYNYPSVTGEPIVHSNGMNPVTFLHQRMINLPRIADWNVAPNFEAIASLNPDVMFIRVGSCWMWGNSDEVPKALKTLQDLGIPLVVLQSPQNFDKPDMRQISNEIRIIGQVFGKEVQADRLAKYLEQQVEFVFDRTRDIPEAEKPRTLLFGLSPRSRKAGGVGNVLGLDTTESYFLEDIIHARNAFNEKGSQKKFSAEHILAMDPDVIVLPTSWGYHPPRELYEAPYYQNLQELKAVKNRRVAALPWTPCNCDKRLEYPIDVMVMAKAAYPDRFQDVDLAEWLLDFYQSVYGVDKSMAIKLRKVQFMEWTLEK